MGKFFKRTKIVATLGPATSSYDTIKELILNGANVFRLNTSHGNMEDHQKLFDTVRNVSKDMDVFTGIMVDLQGPKIRIGTLQHEIELKNGQEVVFQPSNEEHLPVIPVDYDGIANDVKKDDIILIDDGRLEVKVIKTEGNKVYAAVINGGILKSRKGINIPGSTASLNAVTERDIKFIEFAVKNKADYIALSFVRSEEDVKFAKRYIEQYGGNIPIISKIEKPQAIDNLERIVAVSDYIMVARGDLGIEISPVTVPILQKKIIAEANRQRKGVIVATQMLETMITEPIPTRAESSDVANAIIDGADAVMLSAETSVGKFAAQAVAMMAKIAHSIENSSFYKFDNEMEICDEYALTRQAIVFGADAMVKYVNAKALISFSHFGYSTRLMSKLKPSVPIITISDSKSTCRRLALNWGVFPIHREWDTVVGKEFLINLDAFLMKNYDFKKDDYVIITGSAPHLITGRTNFTRVHRIGATAEEN